MKFLNKLTFAVLAAVLHINLGYAQTTGGITKSGSVTAGHIATWKNNSQIQDGGTAILSGGAAGGDLSGTFPNPFVKGLQGNAVASTPPLNTQCLVYSGTFPTGTWQPGACAAGAGGVQQIIQGVGIIVTPASPCILNCTIALDPTASVTSFNGRFGAVVPATNDYSFAQLSGSATNAQLGAAHTALSVIGNATSSTGGVTDIACTNGSGLVLRENSGALGCGTFNGFALNANSTALTKLSNGTALSFVGNGTNGSAAHTDIATTSGSGAVPQESAGTLIWDQIKDGNVKAAAGIAVSKLAIGTANTLLGSINGTSNSFLAVPACATASSILQWGAGVGFQCGINPVISSRATALLLNLNAYNVVTTQGWGSAGDGGGGTFRKLSAGVPFQDSYVTSTGSLAGGTGYGATATYLGVTLTGGSFGAGCLGKVTVTSGSVTAIDITGNLCVNYLVGDILTPQASTMTPGGTGGSGASVTVATLSTPLGSFTDAGSNHMEIVTDSGGFPNSRQFGCKLDYNGNDATATNDLPCMNSGMAFSATQFGALNSYVTGNKFIVPKGASLLCAGTAPFQTLLVPQGVNVNGAGPEGGSTLKQCTAENANTHFVTLCNPDAKIGQFGCKMSDISLITDGPASSNIVTVYSSSGQDFTLLENVYMQNLARGCIRYTIGAGGAGNAGFKVVECTNTTGNINPAVSCDASNTQCIFDTINISCSTGGCTGPAISLAGNVNGIVEKFHIEQFTNGIFVGATGLTKIEDGTITTGCTNGITLLGSNANNTVTTRNIQSSCTTTTVNGHSGGSNVTGSILAEKIYNP